MLNFPILLYCIIITQKHQEIKGKFVIEKKEQNKDTSPCKIHGEYNE